MSSPLNIDIENINLDRTTGPLSVSMENLKSAEQFGEPGSLQLHANGIAPIKPFLPIIAAP